MVKEYSEYESWCKVTRSLRLQCLFQKAGMFCGVTRQGIQRQRSTASLLESLGDAREQDLQAWIFFFLLIENLLVFLSYWSFDYIAYSCKEHPSCSLSPCYRGPIYELGVYRVTKTLYPLPSLVLLLTNSQLFKRLVRLSCIIA